MENNLFDMPDGMILLFRPELKAKSRLPFTSNDLSIPLNFGISRMVREQAFFLLAQHRICYNRKHESQSYHRDAQKTAERN